MKTYKIAIVVSHPIQHFVHLYARLAKNKNIDIKVFFASNIGVKSYYDTQFKKEVTWGNLRLNEFNHVFLNEGKDLTINKNSDASDLNNYLVEYAPDFLYQYGYTQKLQRRAYNWAVKQKIPIIHISDSELRHTRKWYNQLIKRFFLPSFYSKIAVFFTLKKI